MDNNNEWCAECTEEEISHYCENCGITLCITCAEAKNFICPWCGHKLIPDDEV